MLKLEISTVKLSYHTMSQHSFLTSRSWRCARTLCQISRTRKFYTCLPEQYELSVDVLVSGLNTKRIHGIESLQITNIDLTSQILHIIHECLNSGNLKKKMFEITLIIKNPKFSIRTWLIFNLAASVRFFYLQDVIQV